MVAAPEEKVIAMLYLANDIIQNSRRKGTELINEFGRVLPSALKNCYRRSEKLKAVVSRLVWDDRHNVVSLSMTHTERKKILPHNSDRCGFGRREKFLGLKARDCMIYF